MVNRFSNEVGVELWKMGPRRYAGAYKEFGEEATVKQIYEGMQDIVNSVNEAFDEVQGMEPDGCEVILKLKPNVAPKKGDVFYAMMDPLVSDRVCMTGGYKVWIEQEKAK